MTACNAYVRMSTLSTITMLWMRRSDGGVSVTGVPSCAWQHIITARGVAQGETG